MGSRFDLLISCSSDGVVSNVVESKVVKNVGDSKAAESQGKQSKESTVLVSRNGKRPNQKDNFELNVNIKIFIEIAYMITTDPY